MGGDERAKMRPANLLLALDQELDADRQASLRLQPGLDGLDVGEKLTLVITRAAGIQEAVADRRFEGFGRPALILIRRLNIVVPVDQDSRPGGIGMFPFGVDDRIPAGLHGIGLEPDIAQMFAQPQAAISNVARAIGLGADAWNRAEFDQVLEVGVFVGQRGHKNLVNHDGFVRICGKSRATVSRPCVHFPPGDVAGPSQSPGVDHRRRRP